MESIVVEESVYRSQYSSDKKSCTSKWNDPKPVFNNPTFGNFLGSATILIKKITINNSSWTNDGVKSLHLYVGITLIKFVLPFIHFQLQGKVGRTDPARSLPRMFCM